MATPAQTILISKECAYTSTATYYTAVLESIAKSAGVLTFGVKITVTTGSGTELGSGAGNTRTAYVYDAAGNLLGSAVIKNASSGWYASSNYAVTVPCTADVGTAAGTLSGCYIRILHSLDSEYGNVASCYWNGSCKYNASVGNTFSISHDSSYSKTITLRFDARGGSGAPADQSATVYSQGAPASFTIPNGYPTKAGLVCYGWGVDPGAEDYWEGDTIELSDDLTLCAVWVKPITIHYDQNGGSGVSIPDKQDEFYETDGYASVTITTATPVRAGYTFEGWYTAASSGGTVSHYAGQTYRFAESTTLYAVWSKTITITYDGNGGSGAPGAERYKIYYEQYPFKISNVRPYRSGYSFLGWDSASSSATPQYEPGSTHVLSSDLMLYAIWEPDTCSITYDANGGSGAPGTQTYVYAESGATYLSNKIPTRTGYRFLGWALTNNATAASYSPGQAWKLSNYGHYRLYAVWEGDLTLTYDAAGGSSTPPSQGGYPGAKVTLAGAIARKAVQATVTTVFDPNGGTVPVASAESSIITGYAFQFWLALGDGNTRGYNAGAEYTFRSSNVQMVAQWQETVSYGAVELPVPERLGYVFLGWYTAEGAPFDPYPKTDGTVYAHWEKTETKALYAYTKVNGIHRGGPVQFKPGGAWKHGKQIFQKYNGRWKLPQDAALFKETFQSFASPDTVITNTPTVGAYWNGIATPQWNGVPQNGFGTLMVHENEGYNGSKCISASIRGTADAKSRMTIHYRLFDKLTVGATYVLKLKIKKSADLDTDVQVQTQYRVESGNPFFKVSDKVTTEWQEFSFEFVPDGTMKDFILAIGTGKGTKGTVYFDDVSLKMLGNGVELIKDGNFEAFQEYRATPKECASGSTVPWNGIPSKYWSGVRSSGSGSMTVLGEQGVDGGRCLCIAIEAPEKSSSRLSAQYDHGKPLVAGQHYVLKMKVKKSADCDADIALQTQYKSESGNPTIAITKDVGIEWTQIVREFTTEGTMKDFLLMLRVGNSGLRQQGEVYFDDISLTLKDDPTELMHDGGFEDCSPYDSVLRESSVETVTYWNGATPPDGWSVRCKEGAATLKPCFDGEDVSLQMAVNSFTRMLLSYRLYPERYAQLIDGQKCMAYVDLKSSAGTEFESYVEAICRNSDSEYQIVTVGQTWKTVCLPFTFSAQTGYLDLHISINSLKIAKGMVQIDNIRIV